MAEDGSKPSPAACLRVCTEIMSAFDGQDALERNMEKIMTDRMTLSTLNESERTIVKDAGEYFERHLEAVKAIVNNFYLTADGRRASRTDYFTYTALLVLIMDHENSTKLDFEYFSQVVIATRPYKTTKFLAQVFQVSRHDDWIGPLLCRHFEDDFVASYLLPPIEGWKEKGRELVMKLMDTKAQKVEKQPPTVPEPFNLTKPRPREPPQPEPVAKVKHYHPVPQSTYNKPATQTSDDGRDLVRHGHGPSSSSALPSQSLYQLDDAFQPVKGWTKPPANFLGNIAKLPPSEIGGFQHTADPIKNIETIIKSQRNKPDESPKHTGSPGPVAAKATAALPGGEPTVPRKKAKPAPKTVPVVIKSTAAATLRLGARVNRQEEEEARRVSALAAGTLTDDDFRLWQKEVEATKLKEKLDTIEKSHLQGLLSFEQAMIAQQQLKLERHQQVSDLKAESEELLHELARQRMVAEEEARQLVEEIIRGHENTKEARIKLHQQNKDTVDKLSQEHAELLQRARDAAEAEHKRRVDLILQIRAMESVPIERFKEFDRLTSGNHGLLLEMSVAELQERLTELKYTTQVEEERRRNEIKEETKAKEEMLKATEEAVVEYRKMVAKQKEKRDKEEKAVVDRIMNKKDSKVDDLKAELERRRSRKLMLEEEVRAVSSQQTGSRASSGARSASSSRESRSHMIITPMLDSKPSTARAGSRPWTKSRRNRQDDTVLKQTLSASDLFAGSTAPGQLPTLAKAEEREKLLSRESGASPLFTPPNRNKNATKGRRAQQQTAERPLSKPLVS